MQAALDSVSPCPPSQRLPPGNRVQLGPGSPAFQKQQTHVNSSQRRRTPTVPGAGWQAGPRSTVWAAGEVRPSGVPQGLWRGGGRVSKSKGPQWEGSWGEGQPEHSTILEHVVCLRGGRIWREVPVGLSLGAGLSPCSSCWSHPSPVQQAPQMTQKSCAPPSSSQ